jgi:hypothetical protein
VREAIAVSGRGYLRFALPYGAVEEVFAVRASLWIT